MYPFGYTLHESKYEPQNSFKEYDKSSFIDSKDYDKSSNIFVKQSAAIVKMFEFPLYLDEDKKNKIRKHNCQIENTFESEVYVMYLNS